MTKKEKYIKSNFHTHTDFCDGKNSAEDMLKEAIKRDFKVIGFSGHSYVDFDDCCMSIEATEKYIKEIQRLKNKYKNKIDIFTGIEMDFYSDIDVSKYDYVIGSVHYIKDENGIYHSIDYKPGMLRECIDKGFDGDSKQMLKAYFKNISDMIDDSNKIASKKINILGHFDLIRKLNKNNEFFDEHSKFYKDLAIKTIKKAIESDIIIEINTGGMFRGYRKEPYPDTFLLEEIKKLNGKVILSSDAHCVEALDFKFDDIYLLLSKLGINIATNYK